jgi:RNA polymerase sigma factor (sigma-70 family)
LDAVRELACARNGPEKVYMLQESQQDLQAALELLNNRERNLIGLKFWAGLNNRQIAQMTGLSESNVGVILYRSIRRLQLALKKEAFENE